MLTIVRAALAGTILLAAGWSVAVAETRIRTAGGLTVERADWITTDGERVVFGAGATLHVARTRPDFAVERTITLDRAVTQAVLSGTRIYLAGADRRLYVLDLDRPRATARVVPMDPAPRGDLRLSRMDGLLVVAESGRGLSLFSTARHPHNAGGGHHGGPSRPELLGFLPLARPIQAVAASSRTIFAALDGEKLAEIDARNPHRPVLLRMLDAGVDVEALAASESTLYLLGPHGLRAAKRGAVLIPDGPDRPELSGGAIDLAGRRIFVAAGGGGVVDARDAAAGGQLFPVIVGDNFFSPRNLTIEVGDTVRWSNASGFHNVFSCSAGEDGCFGATSNEAFTSGPPADPLWSYDYTFQLPGSNPYLCQSHAFIMPGHVTVEASLGPPAVPDGTGGTPMNVGKLGPSGEVVALDWGTACPGGDDHQILYGLGGLLPEQVGGIYRPSGAQCDVGPGSPYVWRVPRVFGSPADVLLWWLVVATDGDTEGSWGTDAAGNERNGPGPDGSSALCGIAEKDLTNNCGR